MLSSSSDRARRYGPVLLLTLLPTSLVLVGACSSEAGNSFAPGGVSDGTYDGHFVAYDNPTAEADVDAFVAACVAGTTPMIGQ